MRNTPSRPAIEQRESTELIENLCIALRNVGGCWFPDDDGHAAEFIEEVKQIHTELEARRVDVQERINSLSDETSWQMTMNQRCKHADAETVLMTFDDEYDYQMGKTAFVNGVLPQSSNAGP